MDTLQLTRVDDGGLLGVADRAGLGASSLKSIDDLQRLGVSDLAEDDVAAIEPLSLDGGDEELRAVAREWRVRKRPLSNKKAETSLLTC